MTEDEAPVIFPGQIFAVIAPDGTTALQETLVPSGKKRPPVPDQICLSLPIEESP